MKNIQTQLNEFVLPAEWEPQSGVQLTWPHEGTDWKPYLHDIINTEVALAKAIARYEKVIIVTQDVEKTKRHFSSDELNQIHGHATTVLSPCYHVLQARYHDCWISSSMDGERSLRLHTTTVSMAIYIGIQPSRVNIAIKAIWSWKGDPLRAMEKAPSSPPVSVCWHHTATNH